MTREGYTLPGGMIELRVDGSGTVNMEDMSGKVSAFGQNGTSVSLTLKNDKMTPAPTGYDGDRHTAPFVWILLAGILLLAARSFFGAQRQKKQEI